MQAMRLSKAQRILSFCSVDASDGSWALEEDFSVSGIVSTSMLIPSTSPSLISAPLSSADPEAIISLAMRRILAATLSEVMTSLPSAHKFTVASRSPLPTMPSYLKVIGQYLINFLRKSMKEVNLRQKGDMSSVLTPIVAKKGRIVSDENVMTLCTASHSFSATVPALS